VAAYEYECPEPGCEDVLVETKHGMTEEPNILCPRCGDSMRKRFGLSGVVFKGFGWACTDFRTIRTANDVHG
jgi:predicted nucleic acid-binding Zn ribbon protein